MPNPTHVVIAIDDKGDCIRSVFYAFMGVEAADALLSEQGVSEKDSRMDRVLASRTAEKYPDHVSPFLEQEQYAIYGVQVVDSNSLDAYLAKLDAIINEAMKQNPEVIFTFACDEEMPIKGPELMAAFYKRRPDMINKSNIIVHSTNSGVGHASKWNELEAFAGFFPKPLAASLCNPKTLASNPDWYNLFQQAVAQRGELSAAFLTMRRNRRLIYSHGIDPATLKFMGLNSFDDASVVSHLRDHGIEVGPTLAVRARSHSEELPRRNSQDQPPNDMRRQLSGLGVADSPVFTTSALESGPSSVPPVPSISDVHRLDESHSTSPRNSSFQ